MRNSDVAGAKNASTRYSGFIYDIQRRSAVRSYDVREVIREYTPILECGCVELDANYTTFLNRLREAGIERRVRRHTAGAAGRRADQTGAKKRNVDVVHEIRLNRRYR